MESEAPWWEKLVKLDPALVRAFIVTVFALIAVTFNITVLDGTVENVINFVLALSSIIAAVWIRPAVTPNAKVLAYDDTPLSPQPTIKAGEATVPAETMGAVEKAVKEAA